MAFIPTARTAKVAVEGVWSGQKVAQTFWFEHAATEPTDADLLALATHVGTNWVASMLTSTANTWSFVRCTATRQTNNNDIQQVYQPASPVPGTGAGASVPLNANWVFSYRTALRGRNYRGRGYQPGLLNSVLTNPGEGNLAVLGPIAANYVNWLITSLLANWTWVVTSHFLNKVARPGGVNTPITSVLVNSALDSQRRRLVGRGE